MEKTMIPLHPELHQQLKLVAHNDFSHARHDHLLPVVLQEYTQLACEYPLLFVKNAETGQFQAVAMTGLRVGQNFYWHDGRWRVNRVPLSVQMYPFGLIAMDGSLHLAIVADSTDFSNTQGAALFQPDGSEAAFVQQRREQLQHYLQQTQLTRQFTQRLTALNLLEAKVLQLADGLEVNGLYLVSQARLHSLSAEQLQQLHLLGDMQLIMAHLLSLQHIGQLVTWSNQHVVTTN